MPLRRAVVACLVPLLLGAGAVAHAEAPEVASLGPTDATFEWHTDAAETSTVRLRPAAAGAAAADAAWRTVDSSAHSARTHVVEVDDLSPGTTYEYRLGASGASGTLATPAPPPGEVRGVLFVLTDIHLCITDCPDGVRRLDDSRKAYAAALRDILRRARALPADLPRALVILGDLAQHADADVWRAVSAVDHDDLPVCVIPGNHDAQDEDWAAQLAALEERLASPACRYDGARGEVDLGPWRVMLLSSVITGEHGGKLGDDERAWLEERLDEAPDRPAVLATHHPFAVPVTILALREEAPLAALQDGAALEELLGRHPQVAAVLSGHLHLNWTGIRAGVTQFIFSALVQYPMGYHSVTFYDGGMVRRYHPLPATEHAAAESADALAEWGASTGIPFAAGVAALIRGTTADRNAVVELAAPAAAAPAGPDRDAGAAADGAADAAGDPQDAAAATAPADATGAGAGTTADDVPSAAPRGPARAARGAPDGCSTLPGAGGSAVLWIGLAAAWRLAASRRRREARHAAGRPQGAGR